MRRMTILMACMLVLISMAGHRMHRRAAEMARLPLHESSRHGDAYVYFPRATRIRIGLQSQGTTGNYIDAFDTVASIAINNTVALCLKKTWSRTGHADCSKPDWIPAFVSRMLQPKMMTAVFPDDSTRTYAFDSATSSYLPVPGSARDGHGNGIPENIAMASNGGGRDTYGFRNMGPVRDRMKLVRQLSRLGIDGNYADGSSREPITCVARADRTVCLHAL